MGTRKKTSPSASARRRRRLPWGGRLALAVIVVIAVSLVLRQLALRSWRIHALRRASAAKSIHPAATPGGPGPTPVSALPGQHDEPDLRGAEARALLRRAAAAILKAIETGRAFGYSANSVVEAHFAIGTGHWVVREAAAPGTTPQFVVASPAPPEDQAGKVAGAEGWRFRAFRGAEGERFDPMFVFFPDGTVQGGMVEMGWDNERAVIGLDASGKASVECPGTLPPAVPTLPSAGGGAPVPVR